MNRSRKTPGARAGKSPQKQVRTSVTEGKYESGGAKLKRKKGGFVRKPKPPIRYKKKAIKFD
jgi:hypothetical protein